MNVKTEATETQMQGRTRIDALSRQLQNLRIRQQQLAAEQERLVQEILNELTEAGPNIATATKEVPDLQPQEPLPEDNDQQRRVIPPPTPHISGSIRLGSQVYITNRITHVPLFRRATIRDRAAIVTTIDRHTDRIYIRTYNGHKTWRIARNLRHLSERELAIVS